MRTDHCTIDTMPSMTALHGSGMPIKFVHSFLIRNHATLLWFVREVPGYGIAALFAKRAAIWRTRIIFMAKGLDCGALRRGH